MWLPGDPGATSRWQRPERVLPESLGKEDALPTLGFPTSASHNGERMNFSCSKPACLWPFVTAARGRNPSS